MTYVYLLRSKTTNEIYIGSTRDLRRRFAEHNSGRSFSTARGIPWELLYYEAYQSERDARRREHQLKRHAQAIVHFKKRLADTLASGQSEG